MPDWTYVPLHGLTARLFGVDRSRRLALAAVGAVTLLPRGHSIVRAFGFTVNYPAAQRVLDTQVLASPIGLVIADVSAHTVVAVQSMGFGFVGSDVPAGAVVSDAIDFDELMADVRAAPGVVIANAATIAMGPAIAARVNEALEHDARVVSEALPIQTFRPWTWPAWLWAMWLGIAMVCAGVGAAIISLGPVLLPYDREFLNRGTDGLMTTNSRLVQFLQHDRITMAGAMIAIGCNDIGLAFAMRRGWAWARAGFIAAGACGFPTFFLFLGYRFFDPLHFAVAIGFFPLYLFGCFGSRVPPKWAPTRSSHESARRRALVGQLMMIAVALGIVGAGIAIMVIGVRSVFIPSDIAYLDSNRPALEAALNGRLRRFVAHDRAGFGGALTSLGVGVLCTSLWGWRSGERSTYWTLLASSGIGFFAAIIVHVWVGYTDFGHLLPVYLGVVMVGVALLLSREWFLAQPTPKSSHLPPPEPQAARQPQGCSDCMPTDHSAEAIEPLFQWTGDGLLFVVDESHFIVSIRKCRACQATYVHAMVEKVDWVGGNDSQQRIRFQVTEEETRQLRASPDSARVHNLIEQFGSTNGFFEAYWPSSGKSVIRWVSGECRLMPHD